MTDPAPLDEKITAVISEFLRENNCGGMVTAIIGCVEYIDQDGDICEMIIDPVNQPIRRGAGLVHRQQIYCDTISRIEMEQTLFGCDDCDE